MRGRSCNQAHRGLQQAVHGNPKSKSAYIELCARGNSQVSFEVQRVCEAHIAEEHPVLEDRSVLLGPLAVQTVAVLAVLSQRSALSEAVQCLLHPERPWQSQHPTARSARADQGQPLNRCISNGASATYRLPAQGNQCYKACEGSRRAAYLEDRCHAREARSGAGQVAQFPAVADCAAELLEERQQQPGPQHNQDSGQYFGGRHSPLHLRGTHLRGYETL